MQVSDMCRAHTESSPRQLGGRQLGKEEFPNHRQRPIKTLFQGSRRKVVRAAVKREEGTALRISMKDGLMRVRVSRKMSITSLVTGQWCPSQSGNPGGRGNLGKHGFPLELYPLGPDWQSDRLWSNDTWVLLLTLLLWPCLTSHHFWALCP